VRYVVVSLKRYGLLASIGVIIIIGVLEAMVNDEIKGEQKKERCCLCI